MKRVRKIYVLWYNGYGLGWPTLNTPYIRQAHETMEEAKQALNAHNREFPYEKKGMSIRVFKEVK